MIQIEVIKIRGTMDQLEVAITYPVSIYSSAHTQYACLSSVETLIPI